MRITQQKPIIKDSRYTLSYSFEKNFQTKRKRNAWKHFFSVSFFFFFFFYNQFHKRVFIAYLVQKRWGKREKTFSLFMLFVRMPILILFVVFGICSLVQKCIRFCFSLSLFVFFFCLFPCRLFSFTLIHHRLWNELNAVHNHLSDHGMLHIEPHHCRVLYIFKKKNCVYIYIIMLWLLICRLCRHRWEKKREN